VCERSEGLSRRLVATLSLAQRRCTDRDRAVSVGVERFDTSREVHMLDGLYQPRDNILDAVRRDVVVRPKSQPAVL